MPEKKTGPEGTERAAQQEFPQDYTVLGADLSLTRPGFALLTIETKENIPRVTSVKLTSVNNKGQSKKKTHGQILYEIQKEFFDFLDGVVPDFFVREHEIMHMKNPSERSVTKVVGLMDILAYEMNRPWFEIYPVTVKSLVAGSGRAEKDEVAQSLPEFVGSRKYANDDESDATAVAVAWLIQNGQLKDGRK